MTALLVVPISNAPDPLTREVARVLTRRRELLGITVRGLAERTGFAPSTIQNWLTGKRTPNLDDLAVLCDALEISPAAVIVEAQRAAGWQ